MLASIYQQFDIDFRDLYVIIGAKALDVQKKLEAIAARREAINVTEMFEMQMLMNHLSQVSEMATSVVSAFNSAIASMSRNVKG